ncbi:histone demethylation protein 1 [Fusarium langsethiae]|uniref:Histone demethylation protein 1 n=1 Tax=Fusarium langsethiae TaxID=179993 RepID=A0A0M9ELL1_FUSLA|nr:histone demethylation protein 1 [Fusarium langsethiae]GKU10019.1 unnamed protein product [Fusarium langsethiae]
MPNQLSRHLRKHDVDLETYNLLGKFLKSADEPAGKSSRCFEPALAKLVKSLIHKTGGLSLLKDDSEDCYFLDAKTCRVEGVTDEIILNDCLHNFDKTRSTVYSSEQPHSPQQIGNLVPVLAQLNKPNPACVKYATNLGPGNGVRRPKILGGDPDDTEMKTYTNITPEGTFIDLHVDQGYEGITLVGLGCVKLWMMFPPTEYNLAIWDECRESQEILASSWDRLEGGKVAIQTGDKAIILKPGLLHSTFTLRGGLVFGITYITESCLTVTAKLLRIENAHFTKVGDDDWYPFLESVYICMSLDSGRRDEALRVLCEMLKTRAMKKNVLLNKIKEEITSADCFHCGKRWRSHWG